MMKFLRILARVINITIFSILFLVTTTYALSPSSEEGMGIVGYFNLTNILFYSGYVLFGMALLQYIRNKSVDWHNFYLAFVLTLFCWLFLMAMIFSPFFNELFSDDGNPQLFYAGIIEFIINITNEMESSETIPDHFYDYLLNFIVSYNIGSICAILLAIPISVFGVWLLMKSYLAEQIRKTWFPISCILIFLIGIGLSYSTVFGEMTTGMFATYKKREPKAWETEFSYTDKVENIKFAKEQILEFTSQLYIDPVAIISLLGVILLLIISITNKKLNTNKSKILLDEYN